jgi:hypothetical protein
MNPTSANPPGARSLPQCFLNCYDILQPETLSWPVNIYAVDLKTFTVQNHQSRGDIKNVIWDLRKGKCRADCHGYGFVVDFTPRLVAVPEAWKLPVPIETGEYKVTCADSLTACAADPGSHAIVLGILRDGIKRHFKETASPELGDLWQDYGHFCQCPSRSNGDGCLMCRRFRAAPKVLSGGRLVMQCSVTTATLDARTVGDYYRAAEVARVAAIIKAKREQRANRQNQPVSIRVVRQVGNSPDIKAFELEDVAGVLVDAQLPAEEQRARVGRKLRCRQFPDKMSDIPTGELRLVLGSQITQEEHAETILEPSEREQWARKIRNFLDGADICGHVLHLAEAPVSSAELRSLLILPPAVRVRGRTGTEVIIEAPQRADDGGLEQRCRQRTKHIRNHGFLVRRPINPLLAYPAEHGHDRGMRLKKDLERIWAGQSIDAVFEFRLYRNVEDIRRAVEEGHHDTLLAVLPERSDEPHSTNDTHERIKQRIEVASQCIHLDHTLPARFTHEPWEALERREARLANRIRQRYELCLGSLLVKHHWFPFAPHDPFHFNVQIGLDVGGVHDTDAVACMGYGFRRPHEGLFFLPQEIPIEVQKKEPIPTEALFAGLLNLFERAHSELMESGHAPDFGTAVFYRDGEFLGSGELWNEREAIERLHQELAHRGWVTSSSTWTGVEILKRAHGWRLMRNADGTKNPLVGQVVFGIEDPDLALVCTTGAPYLPQGTAAPLLLRISDIAGKADRGAVVRDLVWQADLCFTKPDMGMRLPWVLHVADTGALQLSKAYRISGITA